MPDDGVCINADTLCHVVSLRRASRQMAIIYQSPYGDSDGSRTLPLASQSLTTIYKYIPQVVPKFGVYKKTHENRGRSAPVFIPCSHPPTCPSLLVVYREFLSSLRMLSSLSLYPSLNYSCPSTVAGLLCFRMVPTSPIIICRVHSGRS